MRAARLDLVILCCAVSAGIHGALVPEHLDEGTGAGTGFAVATVLLAAAAVALTARPESRSVLSATVVLLIGLIASYGLAVTTGFPVLHPEPEAVDGLGLASKAVEAAGALAAWSLLPRVALTPEPKGTPAT